MILRLWALPGVEKMMKEMSLLGNTMPCLCQACSPRAQQGSLDLIKTPGAVTIELIVCLLPRHNSARSARLLWLLSP